MRGLPVAGECLEQIFLNGWERDRGAIAAAEAVEMDGHFFALKVGREADAGDDDVRLLRGFDGLVAEDGGWGNPGEVDAGRASAVEVFETNRVGICISEVHRCVKDSAAFGLFLIGAGDDELAVEVEAEALGIFAGVAVVDADTDLVIARRGRGEGSGPADGVVVALQAGDGNDLIPIEIDVAVGAGEDGLAREVG